MAGCRLMGIVGAVVFQSVERIRSSSGCVMVDDYARQEYRRAG